MDSIKPQRKPGRPAIGKRGNFTFRVTDTLRTQLETAAAARHLSVSEEIERRLTQSFELGLDPFKSAALRMIAERWRVIDAFLGDRAAEDPGIYARTAMRAVESAIAIAVDDEMLKQIDGAEVLKFYRGAPANPHLMNVAEKDLDAADIEVGSGATGAAFFEDAIERPSSNVRAGRKARRSSSHEKLTSDEIQAAASAGRLKG